MTDEYYQEIESHFARRRGTPFVFNAVDWALMRKWHEERIPLALVIEAIDSVFDKNEAAGSRKVISSLRYCRRAVENAVKELWADRRDLLVGTGSELPEASVGAALDALASRLESAADPLIREYGPRVRELAREGSVPRVEERLIELEETLIAALLQESPAARQLREDAARVDLAGVDEKTLARTIEANLRRLVRERFEIPRLTLF